jgi:hypothetical protein
LKPSYYCWIAPWVLKTLAFKKFSFRQLGHHQQLHPLNPWLGQNFQQWGRSLEGETKKYFHHLYIYIYIYIYMDHDFPQSFDTLIQLRQLWSLDRNLDILDFKFGMTPIALNEWMCQILIVENLICIFEYFFISFIVPIAFFYTHIMYVFIGSYI